MSKSLALLQQEAMELEQQLIQSDGCLTPELEEKLDLSKGELSTKIDSYKWFIENLEFRAMYFKGLEAEAAKYKKMFLEKAAWLEDNLLNTMHVTGKDELIGHEYRYKKVQSKDKLVIEPGVMLPPGLFKEVKETVLDKEKLRERLEKGETIKGAKLEPSFYVRRSVNSKK